MAKRFHESYGRMSPKHKGGMINDDRSAMANLPKEVMQKEWGGHSYAGEYIEDLYEGVQKQMKQDVAELKKNKGGQYY